MGLLTRISDIKIRNLYLKESDSTDIIGNNRITHSKGNKFILSFKN